MKFPVVWRGLAALAATLLLIHCQVATASEVGSEVVSDRQQSDKKNELLLERNDKEVTDLEVDLALADNNEAHPYIHSRNRRTLGAVFDMFRDLMSNMFGGGGKKKPRRPRPGGYGAPAPTQGYGAPKPTQGYGAPKPTQGYGAPPQPSRPPPPPRRPNPRPPARPAGGGYGAPPQRPQRPPPQPSYGRPSRPSAPRPPPRPQPTYGGNRPRPPPSNPRPPPQPQYGQPSPPRPQPVYGGGQPTQATYGQAPAPRPAQPIYGQASGRPQPPPQQPSYGNNAPSSPSGSSIGPGSVFTILPAPNLATGRPPAGFDAQATYGGTADFSAPSTQQQATPTNNGGNSVTLSGSYQAAAAPSSSPDSYGSPQAPAIGGGAAGDDYSAPQAPVIGAGDDYSSPQAPVIGPGQPAPAQNSYGSPQAQPLAGASAAAAPASGSYGSPVTTSSSAVNPFLSGYGQQAAPLPISSSSSSSSYTSANNNQQFAPVIDSYGISPVPASSSSNTLPSSSAYGSPQAAPVASAAASGDSYGSPASTVVEAAAPQSAYGVAESGPISDIDIPVSTQAPVLPGTASSSSLSQSVNSVVDVFGSPLAPVVPSEPVPDDVAASLARNQLPDSFDAYVSASSKQASEGSEGPVGELVSTEVEGSDVDSSQLQRLDKSLDSNSIEEEEEAVTADYDQPLFDNLRDVAFTDFTPSDNLEPIEIDLTSGNVDLSNGFSDGVTVNDIDLTGTTPKPVSSTTASTTSTTTLSSSTTATTTTESEPEETTTSLEDDYYGDYSGDEYDYDYGDNEVDDDYDPAEYGAAIANEPPSDEPKGSIIDLIDFDSYEDDYDYGDQEEREGKKIGGGKSPDKMTVNDVLEYVDEMMKDVPLDDDEYYDYLEKATTRRPTKKVVKKKPRKNQSPPPPPQIKGRIDTVSTTLTTTTTTTEAPPPPSVISGLLPEIEDEDYEEDEITTLRPKFISVPLKIEELEGIGDDGTTNAGGGPGDPTVILAGTIPEGEETSPAFSFRLPSVKRPGRQAAPPPPVLALPASSVISASNNAKTSPSFGTFLTRIGTSRRQQPKTSSTSSASSTSSSSTPSAAVIRHSGPRDWSQRIRERQRRRVWKQFNLNKRTGPTGPQHHDVSLSSSPSRRQDIYHLA